MVEERRLSLRRQLPRNPRNVHPQHPSLNVRSRRISLDPPRIRGRARPRPADRASLGAFQPSETWHRQSDGQTLPVLPPAAIHHTPPLPTLLENLWHLKITTPPQLSHNPGPPAHRPTGLVSQFTLHTKLRTDTTRLPTPSLFRTTIRACFGCPTRM